MYMEADVENRLTGFVILLFSIIQEKAWNQKWRKTLKYNLFTFGIIKIMFLMSCIVLSGCYATGLVFNQAPAPITGQPVAYVYRPSGHFASLAYCGVYLDGKRVASIGQNGFTWFYLTGDKHEIGASWGNALGGLINNTPEVKITIPVEVQEYYFRLSTRPVYNGSVLIIELVSKEIAMAEIAQFKYEPSGER